jgi:hypothetical protein
MQIYSKYCEEGLAVCEAATGAGEDPMESDRRGEKGKKKRKNAGRAKSEKGQTGNSAQPPQTDQKQSSLDG